jgi:hypothetical protein
MSVDPAVTADLGSGLAERIEIRRGAPSRTQLSHDA